MSFVRIPAHCIHSNYRYYPIFVHASHQTPSGLLQKATNTAVSGEQGKKAGESQHTRESRLWLVMYLAQPLREGIKEASLAASLARLVFTGCLDWVLASEHQEPPA